MVSGDVFRPPKNAILLCVQIGSGVQIITSAFATLFFAALGESSMMGPDVLQIQSCCYFSRCCCCLALVMACQHIFGTNI